MDTITKYIARTQSKCALTAWFIGLLAGFIQGFYGEASLPLVIAALLGSAFLAIAGAVGTMSGLLIRVIIAESRKRKSLWESEEIISGLVLGTLGGGFLGLVAALVSGFWHLAGTCAVSGAYAGAFFCTLLSQRSDMLIQLLTVEKTPGISFDEPQKRQKLPPPDPE